MNDITHNLCILQFYDNKIAINHIRSIWNWCQQLLSCLLTNLHGDIFKRSVLISSLFVTIKSKCYKILIVHSIYPSYEKVSELFWIDIRNGMFVNVLFLHESKINFWVISDPKYKDRIHILRYPYQRMKKCFVFFSHKLSHSTLIGIKNLITKDRKRD